MIGRNTFAYSLFAGAVLALTAIGGFSTSAEAGGARKGFYSQDYQFSAPTDGYEGRATGGYYCSYQKLPNRVCSSTNGKKVCKIKGWTLRQHCY